MSANLTHSPTLQQAYTSLRTPEGHVTRTTLVAALHAQGITLADERIAFLHQTSTQTPSEPLSFEAFLEIVAPCAGIVERTLSGELIVPDFQSFVKKVSELWEDCKKNCTDGKVATYIPQLAKVNPNYFALAVCTVDGQTWSIGDAQTSYCLQSTCKPVSYCLALELHGVDAVHRHVGREPSGRSFNEIALDQANLPHNPMINAGAIMCASLLWPEHLLADRFDFLMKKWNQLIEVGQIQFDNAVFLSEKSNCDRNMALAYFMREKGAFPPHTNLQDTLDLYFQACSLSLTVEQHARVAATLANGGVTPMRSQRIFEADTVRHCLSLMHSCGMYDFSGEYAFSVGIPAKSGVSGAIMIVVPNVMGIVVWSPRLDRMGNSVRGVALTKALSDTFGFHTYARFSSKSHQAHNALEKMGVRTDLLSHTITAASQGDIAEIRRMIARGVDIRQGDYDQRTPLHLAASEGMKETVLFLMLCGASPLAEDRWGNTPLQDAERYGHLEIADLIRTHLDQTQEKSIHVD